MSTTATPRRRAINRSSKAEVDPELKRLAVEFYACNKRANEEKNKADKAREALFKGMKEAGLKSFDLATNLEGREIILDAEIKPGRSTRVIDPVKFRSLVTEDQFIACASIGVTKAEALVGKDKVTRCAEVKEGEENVSVAPRK